MLKLAAIAFMLSTQLVSAQPLFNKETAEINYGSLASKWAIALDDIKSDRMSLHTMIKTQEIIKDASSNDIMILVGRVNRDVNLSIKYTKEEVDTWSTPRDSIEVGRGDCEDYAIAKFMILQEFKVPVKMVIGFDKRTKTEHAVLAANVNEQWVILNNYNHVMVSDIQILNWFEPRFILDNSGVFVIK